MNFSFGINPLPIISVRVEPSHRSEMITQLLFGETFSIESETDEWIKITATYDNYEGFIEQKQIKMLNESEYFNLKHDQWGLVKSPIAIILRNNAQNGTIIPAGSTLPTNGRINFDDYSYTYTPQIISFPNLNLEENLWREEIVQTAMKFISAPYLWGGKTCLGLDCSGFTQTVFKVCGIKLKRDASQQCLQGKHVGFIDEAQTGDLVFFGNPEESITHVGIYMGEGFIIHASGSVRIDNIDHYGIFDAQKQIYTHQLRTIKSFF